MNKYKNLLIISGLLAVFNLAMLAMLPIPVGADNNVAAPLTTQQRCANFQSQFSLSNGANVVGSIGLPKFCSATDATLFIIKLITTIAGVATMLFLMIGGILYVTSAGNEELVEKGKKILINSVIGLVVIIMAYAIVTIIGATLQGK